ELKNFIYRLALFARNVSIDSETIAPLLEEESADPRRDYGEDGDLDRAVGQWMEKVRPNPGSIYSEALAALEKPLFTEVLRNTGGNQLRAANLLGINRNTLRKRLSELELDPETFSRRD
ncbi:MAG: nitrogen regulation protein NR(I), partial [Sphingomonadaceae bacterium]|nr:nitrogen regulation protein NR(I) [Sphingomonadaceae bacterium]